MAITFVASSTATAQDAFSNLSSVTVSTPSGVTTDDVLLAFVSVTRAEVRYKTIAGSFITYVPSRSYTVPGSVEWFLEDSYTDGTGSIGGNATFVLSRVATSSEPASYEFDITQVVDLHDVDDELGVNVIVVAYRGANVADPISNIVSASADAVNVSVPEDNSLVVKALTRYMTVKQFSHTFTYAYMSEDGSRLVLGDTANPVASEFASTGYTLGTNYDPSSFTVDSYGDHAAFAGGDNLTNASRQFAGFNSAGTKWIGWYQRSSSGRYELQSGTLSTAWDLSTAVLVDTYDPTSEIVSSISFAFVKPDGTKLYVTSVGTTGAGATVHQFDLSTAWDVSTAVEAATLSVTDPSRFDVKAWLTDGNDVYWWETLPDPNQLRKAPLSTAWDLSSAGTPVDVTGVTSSGNSDDEMPWLLVNNGQTAIRLLRAPNSSTVPKAFVCVASLSSAYDYTTVGSFTNHRMSYALADFSDFDRNPSTPYTLRDDENHAVFQAYRLFDSDGVTGLPVGSGYEDLSSFSTQLFVGDVASNAGTQSDAAASGEFTSYVFGVVLRDENIVTVRPARGQLGVTASGSLTREQDITTVLTTNTYTSGTSGLEAGGTLDTIVAATVNFNGIGACVSGQLLTATPLTWSPYSRVVTLAADGTEWFSGLVEEVLEQNGLHVIRVKGLWEIANEARITFTGSTVDDPSVPQVTVDTRMLNEGTPATVAPDEESGMVTWSSYLNTAFAEFPNAAWGVGPDFKFAQGRPQDGGFSDLNVTNENVLRVESRGFAFPNYVTQWYGVESDGSISTDTRSVTALTPDRFTRASVDDSDNLVTPAEASTPIFSGPSYELLYAGLAIPPLRIVGLPAGLQYVAGATVRVTAGEENRVPTITTALRTASLPFRR